MIMIYLDNAATQRYVPTEVMRAFVEAVNRKANAGRAAHRDSVWLGLEIYRVREQIKELVDNPDAEVVFTKNCTEALNLAIATLPQGAHVVTTVTEHNSVLRPLHEMQRRGHITLSIAHPAGLDVGVTAADILPLLTPRTRMVVLNHVSNVTGVVNDAEGVGELCAAKGITLVLDAAQSLGHLPVSMRRIGCDLLAAPAHKGLYGLCGVGFLAFAKRVRVRPLLYGGTGTDSINVYQPLGYPEALEAGTLDGAGICALGAGVRWTQAHLNRIEHRLAQYGDRLAEGLLALDEGLTVWRGQGGIVAIHRKGLSSTYLADKLAEAGIAVRAGLQCAPLMHAHLGTRQEGVVRFSAGWNNHLWEVPRVVEAVAAALGRNLS